MFKKFVLALAVALAIPAVAAAQKLGTVDTQSVFQDMPETAAAQTQLNEASKKYEDEFKKLQEKEYDLVVKAIEAKKPMRVYKSNHNLSVKIMSYLPQKMVDNMFYLMFK